MLVLSRKLGERIVIGDNITVKINRIHGNRVTLGIEAPDDVSIMRGELEPIANAFRRSPRDERSSTSASCLPTDQFGDQPVYPAESIR